MQYALTRAGIFAALLAGFAAVETRAGASAPPSETLSLKSGYSRDWLTDRARQVHLTMTLDKTGSGSGTLTFDPNIHDEWDSTCIAIREARVRVRLVSDDAAAKGRRLYELTPVSDEARTDGTGDRWLLVRPLKADAPCSLVFADKDGKVRDVLVLESA
jgi:hypothetical protein